MRNRKPNIMITVTDSERLSRLAELMASRDATLAEALLTELDRARIVPDGKLGANVVRMGSTVRYRTSEGEAREVTLVYPNEADIALGRVSVLTPIGTALIGLSPGQSIEWIARDGRAHSLTVDAVE